MVLCDTNSKGPYIIIDIPSSPVDVDVDVGMLESSSSAVDVDVDVGMLESSSPAVLKLKQH